MRADVEWGKVHNENVSWRTKLIGDISAAYVMPRYVELFEQYCTGDGQPQTFLELGAGNGEIAKLIRDRQFSFVQDYKVSEIFSEGVKWLRKEGFEVFQFSAEQICFKDHSFDRVICFDVMHHTDNPRSMAGEMLRVGRGNLFLTESNGLSLGRKLMELTPGHRAAGEKSYTPREYRSFFEHDGFNITKFEIQPFVFPLKLPSSLTPLNIAFNRWIEKVPFLKWQCSNVYIYVEYEYDAAS